MKVATAVDLQSPIAAAYAPIDNCDVCNAPLRRWEIVRHGRACRVIELGLSRGVSDEQQRRINDITGQPALARRRRGI